MSFAIDSTRDRDEEADWYPGLLTRPFLAILRSIIFAAISLVELVDLSNGGEKEDDCSRFGLLLFWVLSSGGDPDEEEEKISIGLMALSLSLPSSEWLESSESASDTERDTPGWRDLNCSDDPLPGS